MINLIPPSAKKNLKFEYWIRVVSVWLLVWSVAFIIGASLLLPTYVLIGSQISVFAESAAVASARVTNYENVSKALVQSSQQARYALDETRLPVVSDYVRLLKNFESAEIALNNISIARSPDGISPINISGTATGRQALAEFRDSLVSEEVVVEVELPISNLAQDRDISFNLTVIIDNDVSL